jgi:hypothetical protein
LPMKSDAVMMPRSFASASAAGTPPVQHEFGDVRQRGFSSNHDGWGSHAVLHRQGLMHCLGACFSSTPDAGFEVGVRTSRVGR